MIKKLAPVQFDFTSWWMENLKKGDLPRNVEMAFLELRKRYEEIAQWVYEMTLENGFAAQAGAEYGLAMHTALVKHKDIHWLRQTFEGESLVSLSFEIASSVYPKEEWKVLENDEFAVVTNRDRTIVFDLKYFDILSASASLGLVEDSELVLTDTVHEEIEKFYKIRQQRELSVLAQLKQDLGRYSKDAQITPLHSEP